MKDELKLNDVEPHTFQPDPFKTTYNKKFIKDDIAMKVTTVDHWKASTTEKVKKTEFRMGYTKNQRWSEKDKQYRCDGNERLFDKIIRNA